MVRILDLRAGNEPFKLFVLCQELLLRLLFIVENIGKDNMVEFSNTAPDLPDGISILLDSSHVQIGEGQRHDDDKRHERRDIYAEP